MTIANDDNKVVESVSRPTPRVLGQLTWLQANWCLAIAPRQAPKLHVQYGVCQFEHEMSRASVQKAVKAGAKCALNPLVAEGGVWQMGLVRFTLRSRWPPLKLFYKKTPIFETLNRYVHTN